jgi:uncharacterized protein (DUF427 family)
MGLPIVITPAAGRYRIRLDNLILGETSKALLVEEGGHPGKLYFPRADITMGLLTRSPRSSKCPWKGEASYYSVGDAQNVIWSYERPKEAAAALAGYLAVYPEITVEEV